MWARDRESRGVQELEGIVPAWSQASGIRAWDTECPAKLAGGMYFKGSGERGRVV